MKYVLMKSVDKEVLSEVWTEELPVGIYNSIDKITEDLKLKGLTYDTRTYLDENGNFGSLYIYVDIDSLKGVSDDVVGLRYIVHLIKEVF